MKRISTIVIAIAICLSAAAEDSSMPRNELSLDVAASYKFGPNGDDVSKAGFSPDILLSFNSTTANFDLAASVSANRDGKYGAALADIPGGNLYGFYLLLDEGGMRGRLGAASFELGRFRFRDEVDSPFSLFVNSRGISSPTMAVSYSAGPFFYNSRWIGLNHDSAAGISDVWPTGFPERGATIKNFGLELGEMRFGFQDAIVYAQRWLDYEYFLSPLPMYFTQYVRGTGGTPWTTNYDDNTIMGLFWTWKRPGAFSCQAQLLVDDFGLGGILHGWPLNPWQLAGSLGGRLETELGSFGLYSAMATKYCFEPSNAAKASDTYGYSYYPETRFSSYWQDLGTTISSPISVEDNEIGYKYGENNLALQLDWTGEVWGMDLGAAMEFRLSGSNSPANPGHDDSAVLSTGTKWLDDAVLEKRLLLTLTGAKDFGPWRAYGSATGGAAFDALELQAPASVASGTANDIYLYRPLDGKSKVLFGLSLGVRYTL